MRFARGTGAPANFGDSGSPGSVLAEALSSKIGQDKIALQGIGAGFYPAVDVNNWSNVPNDTKSGEERTIALAEKLQAACPSSKLALVGYSQGAMVVHQATNQIQGDTSLVNWISSVLVFGDPSIGQPLGSVSTDKIHSICHTMDQYCDPSAPVDPTAHTTYGENADEAAASVLGQVELA